MKGNPIGLFMSTGGQHEKYRLRLKEIYSHSRQRLSPITIMHKENGVDNHQPGRIRKLFFSCEVN
jgi:hypothetical protein